MYCSSKYCNIAIFRYIVSPLQPVQCSVLEEATCAHPNAWWWIKADGVDLLSGLGESVTGEWSGDVDLNDGSTQQLYKSYRKQLDFLDGISVKAGG